MGNRARSVALTAAAVLSISAAHAREVRYPAAHPRISLVVPDDWKVEETSLGLELQSPQKDSLVLAAVTGADRPSVDGWAQRALKRMRSQGVVPAKSGPATSTAPQVGTGATKFALMNGDRPYALGGAPPTIGRPPIEGDQRTTAARAGDVDLPTVSDLANSGDSGTMKPAGSFLYTGGTLNGQPVDVELTFFPLGKSKRLLFEQQSGPTDARGVVIMHSLREITQ